MCVHTHMHTHIVEVCRCLWSHLCKALGSLWRMERSRDMLLL